MRVLITADTVGGVWSYTRELVAGLLAQGVSVVLATFGRDLNAEQKSWAENIAVKFRASFLLASTSYRLEWMENAGRDIEESRLFVDSLAREYRPDLLHTNQFCFASLDLPMPTVLVAHSDVQSWWFAVHGVPASDTEWQRRYNSLVHEGVHGATMVVAPTHWMLRQIEIHYGTPMLSRVIANGCCPGNFHTEKPKQVQAVSVGRLWDEGKNIRLLERMRCSVPILIAGDPRAPQGSASSAFSTSAVDNLRYLGVLSQTQINTLLAQSAIYIATSRYEPFGLAPVEAAFSGCAILANDIPSLHEVWGTDALYYSPNDPGSLSAWLQRLAGNATLLRQFSQKAVRRAHAQFTASKMTSEYLSLYNTALQLNLACAHA